MSTDHVFAAQMWTWADPMIKRDAQGCILVVNAAFLQLYGGNVESWTGVPIQGWPMPKGPGEISRFESRVPLPTGGETVYDWMECTLQDGSALAMARDVTAYAVQPAQPSIAPSPEPTYPPEQSQSETPTAASFLPGATAMEAEATQQVAMEQPATPAPSAPVVETEQPMATPVSSQEYASTPPAMPTETHVAPTAETPPVAAQITQPAQAPMADPNPMEMAGQQAVPAQPVAPQPAIPQAPVEPVSADNTPQERDFERRALPIEDGDAILGNNWRDAVIAKAVGVDDRADEPENEEQASESPQMAAPQGGQIKVLLAEDNAINALLTRTLLEAEGCLCDVVEDGVLAVEAVKNNEYHMVFMDMRMPNMDGLEATRKIRSMGYGAKALPIVALTANAFDDDRNACFDSGMNDFMTKPVSAEELSAMVKTHTSASEEKMAS